MQTLDELSQHLTPLGFLRVHYVEMHCRQHGDIRTVVTHSPDSCRHPCPVCGVPGDCNEIGSGLTSRTLPIFEVVCYPSLESRRRFSRMRRAAHAS
jgi:hypothetical protein